MPIKMGPDTEIEEIFCSSQIRFHNQPIGVIIAESSQIANQAAELVKVIYQQTGMPSQIILLKIKINLFASSRKKRKSYRYIERCYR